MRSFLFIRAASAAVLSLGTVALPARAQDRAYARGRVVDAKSRDGIEGAEILVGGTSRIIHSAQDGAFTIDGATGAAHTARVRRIGYATAILVINRGDAGLIVALVPAPRELDALVVTASRRAQKLKDVVSSTEIVTREDIENTGASNIAAVLAEQTGVQFTGGHPSGSGVSLQGLSDQRVLILVDGLPLYGRISGGLDLTRIPTSAVERVEIVKGPQSTLYGSEAMGGVVNVITRQPASAQSDVEIHQTAGNDRRSDTDLFAAFDHGRLSGSTTLGHRYVERTAGIAGTAGALTDRLDGVASLRWKASSQFGLDANIMVLNDRARWLSGSLYQYSDNTQTNAHVGGAYAGESSSFSTTLYLSQLDHLSRASQFTSPIAGTGDRQTQRLEQVELIGSHRFDNMVVDAGAIARHEYITSTDGRVAGGERTLDSAEPYAQLEFSGSKWSVVPGARVSWNEQWGTYVSPKIAARFQATPALTLRASVARGYRAPDFKELYLDFTNDAAFYAVKGNGALRPETSENVSLGVEWDVSRVYARAQLFANTLHDFIETQALASVGNFSQYTYGNISSGTTRGVELTSGTSFRFVRAELGYAYLSAIDNVTGGSLLGQPKNSARILASSDIPFATRLTATGIFTGLTPMQRATDGTINSYRDAFTRFNLHADRQFLSRYSLSVGVDNVFNTQPARWADATQRQVYVSAGWNLRAR